MLDIYEKIDFLVSYCEDRIKASSDLEKNCRDKGSLALGEYYAGRKEAFRHVLMELIAIKYDRY